MHCIKRERERSEETRKEEKKRNVKRVGVVVKRGRDTGRENRGVCVCVCVCACGSGERVSMRQRGGRDGVRVGPNDTERFDQNRMQ